MKKKIEIILKEIRPLLDKGKPQIIGIDGSTGSGKTTLVTNLKDKLKEYGYHVVSLHLDDFIHDRKTRYNGNFEEWYCFYHLQWRYDYIISEILNPLKNNLILKKKLNYITGMKIITIKSTL